MAVCSISPILSLPWICAALVSVSRLGYLSDGTLLEISEGRVKYTISYLRREGGEVYSPDWRSSGSCDVGDWMCLVRTLKSRDKAPSGDESMRNAVGDNLVS